MSSSSSSSTPPYDVRTVNRIRLACGVAISCLLAVTAYVAIPDMVPYKPQLAFLTGVVACHIAFILWAEKNKLIAGILAWTPGLPADMIYLNQIDINNLTPVLIRAIPIVGNVYDTWRIFISGTLKPAEGWSSNLF